MGAAQGAFGPDPGLEAIHGQFEEERRAEDQRFSDYQNPNEPEEEAFQRALLLSRSDLLGGGSGMSDDYSRSWGSILDKMPALDDFLGPAAASSRASPSDSNDDEEQCRSRSPPMRRQSLQDFIGDGQLPKLPAIFGDVFCGVRSKSEHGSVKPGSTRPAGFNSHPPSSVRELVERPPTARPPYTVITASAGIPHHAFPEPLFPGPRTEPAGHMEAAFHAEQCRDDFKRPSLHSDTSASGSGRSLIEDEGVLIPSTGPCGPPHASTIEESGTTAAYPATEEAAVVHAPTADASPCAPDAAAVEGRVADASAVGVVAEIAAAKTVDEEVVAKETAMTEAALTDRPTPEAVVAEVVATEGVPPDSAAPAAAEVTARNATTQAPPTGGTLPEDGRVESALAADPVLGLAMPAELAGGTPEVASQPQAAPSELVPPFVLQSSLVPKSGQLSSVQQSAEGTFRGAIDTRDDIDVDKDAAENKADSMPIESSAQAVEVVLRPRATWWDDADVAAVRQLEQATCSTRLLDVEIVVFKRTSTEPVPWSDGQSSELYTRLGAQDPARTYVAFWMNMGDVSCLFMNEAVDLERLENCLADDVFGKRCKLLLQPVRASLPLPAKGPRAADYAGDFFGRQNVSFTRQQSASGASVICLRVDLFSKWLVKMAMSKIGFRLDNVVEVLLLDWPGQTLLSACRLIVTEELQRLLGLV